MVSYLNHIKKLHRIYGLLCNKNFKRSCKKGLNLKKKNNQILSAER